MAKNLIEAIEAELKVEGVKESANGFTGQRVRNMDVNDPLAEGDIINIPNDYKVLEVTINPTDAAAKPTPFIMVEVGKEGSDQTRFMRFFPNQLAKIAFPITEDGKRLPKVKTSGPVAVAYSKFEDVGEALNSLKGKRIKVTKDTLYTVENRFTGTTNNTHIYEYDWA